MRSPQPGDKVRLAALDDWFFQALEAEQIERLKRWVGREVTFVGPGGHGFLEVEFVETREGKSTNVSIWVPSSCLEFGSA